MLQGSSKPTPQVKGIKEVKKKTEKSNKFSN